jgi:hypothetical protein
VNGTWQSIWRWGENEGLDGDQHTAFEILAATYVVSFYDEAIVEATNSKCMKNSLKGGMACVNWQDGIRITKSLYVCLSQDPQELENVSSDHEDYIRKQKKRNLTLLEKAKIL